MGNNENRTTTPLLQVENLVVHYETDSGVVEAINNVSFTLDHGETLGLVGETGAGKTSIAKSIIGILPTPPSHIIGGKILFDGENLLEKKEKEWRRYRGKRISMIFQDPMTALNPVKSVGEQIAEVVRLHEKLSKYEAKAKAEKMLELVGIDPDRYNDFPHQFSGGMKQRVVIAIALACQPELLIADEPTTALDVTIQAQVLELMKELKEHFNTSMLMITHDLGVVLEVCDKCAIVYAGEVIEYGDIKQIFTDARHPYTKGLFDSLPRLDVDAERLKPIPGMMSDPMNLPSHCSFYDRCERRCESCLQGEAPYIEVESGHFVRCLFAEKEGV